MMHAPDLYLPPTQADMHARYQALAQAARYGHYVRIPERICRCLDYFNVNSERAAVAARLHAYYLFIGVVDDALDAGRLEAGRDILKQLANRQATFDEATRQSSARLVTEVLKSHISPELYPLLLPKLEALYQAVVGERQAATLKAYIAQRRLVGCLTAELSYLLIRPLLDADHAELSRMLQQVGAIGCLIDSLIDLSADTRAGLLNFKPTLKARLMLGQQILRAGLQLTLRYPRLSRLFLEAVGDDLLDRLRARKVCVVSDHVSRTQSDYACERAG